MIVLNRAFYPIAMSFFYSACNLFVKSRDVTRSSDSYIPEDIGCFQTPLIPFAMSLFATGWYLLYTKSRHEKKIATHLTDLSIESYLPTLRSVRTWADRKKIVYEPLFPSYLFINIKNQQEYFQGLAIDGVFNYVKVGKQSARVSEELVNNIKLSTTANTGIEVSYEEFEPGSQLLISQGPLTGLSCEAVSHKSKEKYLVRVQLLKRCILLTLPANALVAAL